MTDRLKLPWILLGYDIVAKEGFTALKVEQIAKKVNKSKSSFYHHFADIEIFTEQLLEYHLERAEQIEKKIKLCQKLVPDLLNLFVEIKLDLLFNRQLRINRDNLTFTQCFEKANAPIITAIFNIWSDDIGLTNRADLSQMVLNLTIENFYLQITEKNLTYDWLLNFLQNIRAMVKEIKK
jgi:AcrR family transcriptional regulator